MHIANVQYLQQRFKVSMLLFPCNILNSECLPKQPFPLPDTQSVFCGWDDWTDPSAGLMMMVSRQNTDSSGPVHLISPLPTDMMYLCLLFDLLNKGAGGTKEEQSVDAAENIPMFPF